MSGWLQFSDTHLVSLSVMIPVVWTCRDHEIKRSCEIGVVLGVMGVSNIQTLKWKSLNVLIKTLLKVNLRWHGNSTKGKVINVKFDLIIWVISFHLCVAWEREYFEYLNTLSSSFHPCRCGFISSSRQYEFPLVEFKQSSPLSVPYCSVHANTCGHVENWVGGLVMLKWNQLFPYSFSHCPLTTKRKRGREMLIFN